MNEVPKVTSSKIETRIYVTSDSQCFYVYDFAVVEMRPKWQYELFLRPQFCEGLETSVVPGSACDNSLVV